MTPEKSTTPDLEEVTRRSVEAFARGDFDAALATLTPDAVWDASPLSIGVIEGREGIPTFAEEWIGAYEDYEGEVEEFRDLSNGVTFAVFLQKGRPVGSAGFVQLHYATVGISRDGRFERITYYTDIDEARAAAERLAQERG